MTINYNRDRILYIKGAKMNPFVKKTKDEIETKLKPRFDRWFGL